VIFTHPDLICACSKKPLNTSLVYGETIRSLNNRKAFLSGLGVNLDALVCAKQVHAANVHYAVEADKGSGAYSYDSAIVETDALITDRKNIALAIFTADCLSIFLYDPLNKCIGIIHAGWKSTRERIAAKTVERLKNEFNSKPQNILAGFGPSLKSCCYEVGKEFNGYFSSGVIKREGKFYCDLAAINRKELLDAGLRQENITESGICTACRNDEYFSFRKEKESCGRMMSVIMIR